MDCLSPSSVLWPARLATIQLTDAEIDEIVAEYLSRHGFTTGRTYLAGYLRSLELRVQRRRVRESLVGVDSQNTALRWGIVIYCSPTVFCTLAKFFMAFRWPPLPHSLGACGALKCSNNLSQTVLELFLNAVERWPMAIMHSC